jgi:hypothetical protein
MADLVKSVEFVEVNSTGTEISYDLTMGQDYTNCVPFLSSRGSSNEFRDKTWDCYFSGTTESGVINFRRYNGGDAAYVNCYVVEFDPEEVYVEQGSFDCSSTTDSITTISGFDASSTAMVHWWRNSDNSRRWDRVLCRGRVTGDGSLDFYRNDTGYSLNGHWFIFEAKYGQFIVEHRDNSSSSGYTQVLNKSYDPLKTFVIGSYAADYSSHDARWALSRLWLYHRSDVRWDKTGTSYTVWAALQVIEFQDEKIHIPQSYIFTLNNTDITFNWNREDRMQIPTTSGFSMAIKATPYFDRSSSGDYAAINYVDSTIKLDNEYQISFKKSGHYADMYTSSSFVVDWAGYTVASGFNDSPLDPSETFVKSVQNSRILVEDWQGAVPLTKGQDINNCVIFASNYCNGNQKSMYAHMHEVFLSDTNMVCARRVSGSDEGVVDVSIVEFYPDQVRVQSGAFNQYNLSTEKDVTLDYAVDTEKSFILAKWAVSSSSDDWEDHCVRCRIKDSNTVSFYRNNNSGQVSLTWFVAEDITEDNSCFEVTQWSTTSDEPYPMYRSGEKHYNPYNTFLIVSAAADYSSHDARWATFRAYYDFPTRPVILNKTGDSYNIWFNSQIVQITRSGRCYVQHWNPNLRTAPYIGEYTEYFEGHTDLTSFNTTMSSFCRELSGNYNAVPGVFCSIRITDYDTREVTCDRYTGYTYDYYTTFNIICWTGSEYNDDASGHLFPTKSLVRSVEYLEYYGSSYRNVWWLSKGQDPAQCVPFATWTTYMTDDILQRGVMGFYIQDEFGPPYSLLGQRGTSTHSDSWVGVYLVEFDDRQVKVQRGSYGGTTNNTTITIEEVDLDKAFLVAYGYVDAWSDNWDDHLISCTIEDSTTLRFKRHRNSGAMHISWYVVECLQDQWQVQHLTSTQGGDGTSFYNSLSYRVPLNLMWQFNYYSCEYTDYAPNYTCCRTWPRTDMNIQIQKDSSYYRIYDFYSEVVRFNKDLGVYVAYEDIGGNYSTKTYDISDMFPNTIPFNEEASIVFNPTIACNVSRVNDNAYDSVSLIWSQQKLIDIDSDPKLQLTRANRKSSNSYPGTCVTSFPSYNKYFFEGTVKEERLVPAQRKICLFRTMDHSLVDWTISISGTGYFYLETPYYESHYAVCFDDQMGKDYNHLVQKDVYPTAISGTFSIYEGLTVSGLSPESPLNPYSQYEVPEWQTW